MDQHKAFIEGAFGELKAKHRQQMLALLIDQDRDFDVLANAVYRHVLATDTPQFQPDPDTLHDGVGNPVLWNSSSMPTP